MNQEGEDPSDLFLCKKKRWIFFLSIKVNILKKRNNLFEKNFNT